MGEGGVYMDTDVSCIVPIDEWTDIFIEREYQSRLLEQNIYKNPAKDDSAIHRIDQPIDMLVGIENFHRTAISNDQDSRTNEELHVDREQEEKNTKYTVRAGIVQWVLFASHPNHPLLQQTVDMIYESCQERRKDMDEDNDQDNHKNKKQQHQNQPKWKCVPRDGETALEITGPTIFTKSVEKYMARFGFNKDIEMDDRNKSYFIDTRTRDNDDDKRIRIGNNNNNVGIFDVEAFGCCWDERFMDPFDKDGTLRTNHPNVLITHGFYGRWKGKRWLQDQLRQKKNHHQRYRRDKKTRVEL